MTMKTNRVINKYSTDLENIEIWGSYPEWCETIHEAVIFFEWDDDSGHPYNSLRGFYNDREDEWVYRSAKDGKPQR